MPFHRMGKDMADFGKMDPVGTLVVGWLRKSFRGNFFSDGSYHLWFAEAGRLRANPRKMWHHLMSLQQCQEAVP